MVAKAKKVFDEDEATYVEVAPQEYARVDTHPESMVTHGPKYLRVDELIELLQAHRHLCEYTNIHEVCVAGKSLRCV